LEALLTPKQEAADAAREQLQANNQQPLANNQPEGANNQVQEPAAQNNGALQPPTRAVEVADVKALLAEVRKLRVAMDGREAA
jgi:hypothetical protein